MLADQGHDLRARQGPPLRVVPAHEGLQGLQAAGLGMEDGLIDEIEGLGLQGRRQFPTGGGHQPLLGQHPLIEEPEAIPTAAFDLVEGQIRPLQQGLLLGGVLGADRGTDARADLDSVPLHLIGLADGRQDPGGHPIHILGAADMELDDGKLITPQAGHHILIPHLLAQALGDLDQEAIPHGMAILVVDGFEAVQIDHQHRAVHIVPQAEGDGLLELALEHGAIVQPGEGVRQGQLFQAEAVEVLQEHLPQLGRPLQIRIPPGQGLALGLFAPGLEGGAGGQFQ